jgi:NADH dehydrogenase FAD-containing subunit
LLTPGTISVAVDRLEEGRLVKRQTTDDRRVLLPELSVSLGKFTLRKMRRRGVDVRLGARAVRVTDRHVLLESGEILAGGTIICTIGTQPNSQRTSG